MSLLTSSPQFQMLLHLRFPARSVSLRCSSLTAHHDIGLRNKQKLGLLTEIDNFPTARRNNQTIVHSPINYILRRLYTVNDWSHFCSCNNEQRTSFCNYSVANSPLSAEHQEDHRLGNFDCADPATLEILLHDFIVKEDFISEEEEQSMLTEIDPYLKRMKYEYDHWDDAIHGFRETERNKWTQKNNVIIQRIRDTAFPPTVSQLQYVHLLDLEKTGYIKPHVDSIKFCGNTIAGVSLLSSGIMRLVDTGNKDKFADVLIKRRSLYIMRDKARYNYTHEVLGEKESCFRGQIVPRDRRISVICRNEP